MSKVITKKAAAAKGLSAWSFSRLSTYNQCPLKFKLTVLDGMREPGSAAMDRGSAIHKEGELYFKDSKAVLPPSYKLLAQEMAEARALGAQSELEVCFTKYWAPTGWFDSNAWVRIKIDILFLLEQTIKIVDIKTGKNRGGYEDQLELYVLAALIMYPEIKHVAAELWFVDSGEIIGTSHGAYTRSDLPKLKKTWEKRVKPMFIDKIMAPRPNQYCGWCVVGTQGGCEYAKPKSA